MPDDSYNNGARKPWAVESGDVIGELDVDLDRGISASEVKKRRNRYGKNILRELKKKSAWSILVDQFKSLIIWLLIVAAGVSLAFGEWVECIAIGIVIIINAAIGFVTELRAIRSMDALRKMGRTTAIVRRDGENREIPADQIVVGDIIIFDGGDVVSADCRILEASKLQANESALTGESVPVGKTEQVVDGDAGIADRRNMLYKGTAVTRGSGEAVVVAVGMNTELGRISELVEEAEEEATPLEKRLDKLGHKLIWVTLAVTGAVALLGIIRGKDVLLMIESGIALAVAAIPEGLPIVATIALARGMMRMARRNALINRLSSVETLGATNIICTDKTGTLTENRMTVTALFDSTGDVEIRKDNGHVVFIRDGEKVDHKTDRTITDALKIGILCNNASLSNDSDNGEAGIGDPMEVALLKAGAAAGLKRNEVIEKLPEKREEAFDPDVKMMATLHQDNGRIFVAVKGAPEAVIDVCSSVMTADGTRELEPSDRELWSKTNEKMARDGLRVLAVAEKYADSKEADPYENLTLTALVGLKDPPREDVRDALGLCAKAGLGVVMVTGDQPATALNIARSVNLVDDDYKEVIVSSELKSIDEMTVEDRRKIIDARVFSRVSPKQKLDLISIHQNNKSIVAMTGDGVNDAPALKKADIGIAMGKRGTQVAREAADMILKDDAFSSIVEAVEQGRIIFNNIRKFVLYLLSCNVSEIMIVGTASMANTPLPILPLQILFLNLVTDVFPALALGVGEGDPNIMQKPPRRSSEPILTGGHWIQIGYYGVMLTMSVLGAFLISLYWLDMSDKNAVTVSFLTLAFGQLGHVFNMRNNESGLFINEITGNRWVWGALVLCVILILGVLYIRPIADVIGLSRPDATSWLLIIVFSLAPLSLGQIFKLAGLGKQ
jgi:Ca2+-transporting ATPase